MDVFDLQARLGMDKSEYEAGVKDAKGSMSDLAKNIGNGLKTVAKVGATAIGAAATGVAALTKMSVEGYAQYEQLAGGVETLFGKAAREVELNAKYAYETAGLSANAYMETVTSFSASLLQSLGGDTEKAASYADRAIIDMSDNANKMGTSMEMIQNAYNGFAKGNYTMLDNLKLGYGGTAEEMKRLIKDASKMKDVQSELGITVDANSDSFGNIVNAISVMQASMGIAGTTSREAASTISGSFSMAKAAWENLVTAMSDDGVDLASYVDNFTWSVSKALENVMPRIGIALEGVVSLIDQLAPVVLGAIPELLGQLLPSVLSTATALLNQVVAILPDLISLLTDTVIPSLLSGLESVIGAVISALPGVVSALVSALPTLLPMLLNAAVSLVVLLASELPNIIQPIIAIIPELLMAWYSALLGNLPLLIQCLSDLVVALLPMIPQTILSLVQIIPQLLMLVGDALIASAPVLWEAIKNIAVTYWNELTNFYKTLVLTVYEWLKPIIDIVVPWLADLWAIITEWFSNTWASITEWFSTTWAGITEWFSNAYASITGWLADLWQSVCDGVSAAWAWISGIFSTVSTWIYDNVIAPVAQYFAELWQGIVDTYHMVIDPWIEIFKRISAIVNEEVVTPVKEFFVELWNSIVSGLETAWNWCVNLLSTVASWIYENVTAPIMEFFVQLWSDLKESATELWNSVKDAAVSAWNGIKNAFSVASSWFNTTIIQPVGNFFKNMWSGLKSGASDAWSGIKSVFSNITSWFHDKFTQAWTAVKNVFSTGGKVFDGIKEGIVSVFKTVVNAIIGGINKVISVPFNALNNILQRIRNIEIVGVRPFDWVTTFNVPQIPKLSTGLNYVPYDEYPAFLHRGEAVLTAAQARAWRNGQGGAMGNNGQILSTLVAILNAINGGNEDLVHAVMADKSFSVSGREFGRLVREYA